MTKEARKASFLHMAQAAGEALEGAHSMLAGWPGPVYQEWMANHSYIDLKKPMEPALAEELLIQVADQFWGNRIRVQRKPEWESTILGETHRVWHVYAPHTSLPGTSEARTLWKSPGDDFGFTVYYQHGQFEFRHPFNGWEHWAMRKVRQEVCKTLNGTLRGDGEVPASELRLDLKPSFRDFLIASGAFGSRMHHVLQDLRLAPAGFRD